MARLPLLVIALAALVVLPALAQQTAPPTSAPVAAAPAAAPTAGIAVSGTPAAAETIQRLPVVTGPLHLTPDQAAALALQRSTTLAVAAEGVNTAESLVLQAKTMTHPQVNGQVSYTRMGPASSITLPGDSVSFTISPTSVHRETVTATVPLYLGKRDRYAIQGAHAGVEAAQQQVEASQISIAFAARQAVYGVLRAQQLATVAQKQLAAVNEHLRVTQAMFEQGTTAKFEVVQAQTAVVEAQYGIIQSQTGVEQQKAALTLLLGVPQGIALDVEEGVAPGVPPGDLHQLIGTALEQRPEIAALQAVVRAQQANLRLAQANDNPSLGLQGTVSNQTASFGTTSLSWNVALALTLPIYQGGATQAQVAQAQAALNTAKLNVEATQQQIALQVTQVVLGYNDARDALTVARQAETEALERMRIAQVRFLNGVSLGVEVLDAQTALATAQTQVVTAQYNLQVATASLRAALGFTD